MQSGLSSWDATVVINTNPGHKPVHRHLHRMLPHQQPGGRPKGAYLRWRMDCGQGIGSPQTGIWSSGASAPLLPSTHMGPGGSLEQAYLRCGCKRESSTPTECGLRCPGLAQLSPAQLLLPSVSNPSCPSSVWGSYRPGSPIGGPLGSSQFPGIWGRGAKAGIPTYSLAKTAPNTPSSSRARHQRKHRRQAHTCVSTSPMHANRGYQASEDSYSGGGPELVPQPRGAV